MLAWLADWMLKRWRGVHTVHRGLVACLQRLLVAETLLPRRQHRSRGRHRQQAGPHERAVRHLRGTRKTMVRLASGAKCTFASWRWPAARLHLPHGITCASDEYDCIRTSLSLYAEGAGGMRSGAIVGTCEDMCPEVERERRSRLSDIQVCACRSRLAALPFCTQLRWL